MKWVNTLVVIDMNSGAILREEGYWYDGPVAECKQGKTGQQKTAEYRSTQDQQKENQLTDTAQGTLSQFEGPVEKSPFYKALLTSGIESTSRAYDNARSNIRARANAAGFGYTQPVAQGSENELQAREATDLAAVPRDAMVKATAPALQAAGETANMGGRYGSESLGWGNQAADLEKSRKSFLDRLNQVGQFVGNVGSGIAGAGTGIAKMRA